MPKLTEQELKEAARRIVESSCREQGLEVQITDPVVIGKVAAILRAHREGVGDPRQARRRGISEAGTGTDDAR